MQSRYWRRTVVCLVSLLAMCSGVAFGQDACQFKLDRGQASIQREGATDWTAVGPDPVAVRIGDRIKTEAETRGNLVYPDDSTFRVKSNTVLTLQNQAVQLQVGETWFNVQKQGRNFQVVTPSSVCGVLGTSFDVTVGRSGDTRVRVFEGSVSVRNHNDARRRLILKRGEMIQASMRQSLPPQSRTFDANSVLREEATTPSTGGTPVRPGESLQRPGDAGDPFRPGSGATNPGSGDQSSTGTGGWQPMGRPERGLPPLSPTAPGTLDRSALAGGEDPRAMRNALDQVGAQAAVVRTPDANVNTFRNNQERETRLRDHQRPDLSAADVQARLAAARGGTDANGRLNLPADMAPGRADAVLPALPDDPRALRAEQRLQPFGTRRQTQPGVRDDQMVQDELFRTQNELQQIQREIANVQAEIRAAQQNVAAAEQRASQMAAASARMTTLQTTAPTRVAAAQRAAVMQVAALRASARAAPITTTSTGIVTGTTTGTTTGNTTESATGVRTGTTTSTTTGTTVGTITSNNTGTTVSTTGAITGAVTGTTTGVPLSGGGIAPQPPSYAPPNSANAPVSVTTTAVSTGVDSTSVTGTPVGTRVYDSAPVTTNIGASSAAATAARERVAMLQNRLSMLFSKMEILNNRMRDLRSRLR